ncbi:hypothetical protein PORY_002628 [Pneumocystis oryctolagi]|uniref:Uncharacterized protein n=1 Tax=Pneumocystis oryctolagi TaxID=42067 RepID=A0ACB7C9E1_9ASCO|nr:hypothetical protein PORY_002628 [Pneumocystis oryctolagi]
MTLKRNCRLSLCMTIIFFLICIALESLVYLFKPFGISKEKNYVLSFLVIIPGISYFYVWTFFVAMFVEDNFFAFIVLLSALYYGGRYLEKSWGSKNFAKFILVIAVIPNIFTWSWYCIRYMIERNAMVDKMDRTKSIHGGYALYSGFLVAFKQLVPEHTVTFFKGIFRIRIKYVPILYVFIISLIGLMVKNGSFTILAWSGFLSSWIYLRFFKKNIPNLFSHIALDLRGDTSSSFSFANFFPQPIYSVVDAISKKIDHFLVSIHIYTPISIRTQQTERITSNFQKNSDFFSHLGTSRFEAERRRTLALKALEQRLGSLTTSKHNVPLSPVDSTTIESSNFPLIIDNENKNQNESKE